MQAVDDDSDDDTFSTSTRAALKNRAAAAAPPPALGLGLGRGVVPPPKLPTTMRECTRRGGAEPSLAHKAAHP